MTCYVYSGRLDPSDPRAAKAARGACICRLHHQDEIQFARIKIPRSNLIGDLDRDNDYCAEAHSGRDSYFRFTIATFEYRNVLFPRLQTFDRDAIRQIDRMYARSAQQTSMVLRTDQMCRLGTFSNLKATHGLLRNPIRFGHAPVQPQMLKPGVR
jgi:hypothetical protein